MCLWGCLWMRLRCPWDSPGKNTGVGCHFLLHHMKVKSESEVSQSCPTLCDPMDCSPPGSSVHGIFQARVLEWGAIAFSKFYVPPCNSYIEAIIPNMMIFGGGAFGIWVGLICEGVRKKRDQCFLFLCPWGHSEQVAICITFSYTIRAILIHGWQVVWGGLLSAGVWHLSSVHWCVLMPISCLLWWKTWEILSIEFSPTRDYSREQFSHFLLWK